MARTLVDNCGIVYLFTNDVFCNLGIHKFGITINPFERKRIQSNSTPPNHPFYDEVIIFSKSYKSIEKKLKEIFVQKEWIINNNGENGGCEWIQCAQINEVINVYKSILISFPDSELCHNGRRYVYRNNAIIDMQLPNCRMDFLGIKNGDKIKCISDNKEFEVRNNKILVNGQEMTLTKYMNENHPRNGITNQHNGYQYFTYKRNKIYEMWQELVTAHI